MGISRQNRFIKITIVREAAGQSFGQNDWDLVDPDSCKDVGQLFGFAGALTPPVNTETYALYRDMDFNQEITDRTTPTYIGQEWFFVHRSLEVPADLLLRLFTVKYGDSSER